MSMEHTEAITCPECGKMQDFTIWLTLNGDLDPEAKQQLLEGTLFNFECKNCGHKSNVNYGLLYHDMTHKAMVYYVDESSVEQTQKTMQDAQKKMGFEISGYRKRIVTDRNSLREKAIIFEHDLDDRIIEIIKVIFYANAREQFPEAGISDVYFLVADDRYILDFVGEKALSADIPRSLYEKINNDFADRLAKAGDEETVIDFNWAARFIK